MARADGGWTADEWATAEREADWILQMARSRAQSRQSAADSDDEDDDTEQQQNPLAAARRRWRTERFVRAVRRHLRGISDAV